MNTKNSAILTYVVFIFEISQSSIFYGSLVMKKNHDEKNGDS